MSDSTQVGKIGWIDMTVDDADGVRDFYKSVVGWETEAVSMGDYSDYSMTLPESDEAVSGICHARGGEVLVGPKGLAGAHFCVIRDPSGATAALYQP
jgi:predicted enzyme related to lactoylglutathione lyase